MTRRLLRWLGIIVATLLLLIAVAAAAIYFLSARRLQRVYPLNVVVPRTLPDDAATVARGRHIASAMASCTLCHGHDLGGQMMGEASPVGILAAPNLTRGTGGLGNFSDADWVRAIRHGVRADGTTLLIMPSETFVYMNEPDVAALVAYLKQLPPVDRVMPSSRLTMLGRALLVAGQFSVLVAEKTPKMGYPEVVPPGPTLEYGRYLASFTGCMGCHGFELSGGQVAGPPDAPPATNLTPDPATGIASWSEADFERALRRGVRPDGRPINIFMPWPIFSGLTDDEVRALWLYVRSVPPKAFGNK